MPAWWNGRHKRLKISGPEGRAGSSPAAGTSLYEIRSLRTLTGAMLVGTNISNDLGSHRVRLGMERTAM